MIPNIGVMELLVLIVIVLLLFGSKRIPELARGLGSGVREFRKGISGEYDGADELKHDGDRDGSEE
ncbi:MAG: twin-arginine translocase TatA/TatE family subunit [Nodosilinea sp.]